MAWSCQWEGKRQDLKERNGRKARRKTPSRKVKV